MRLTASNHARVSATGAYVVGSEVHLISGPPQWAWSRYILRPANSVLERIEVECSVPPGNALYVAIHDPQRQRWQVVGTATGQQSSIAVPQTTDWLTGDSLLHIAIISFNPVSAAAVKPNVLKTIGVSGTGTSTLTISGRILDPSGIGTRGLLVGLEGTSVFAITGADGSYALLGIPAGDWRVVVIAPAFTVIPPGRAVTLAAAPVGEVDLTAYEHARYGPIVYGQVLELNGQPKAGWPVYLITSGYMETITNVEGWYVFTDAPPYFAHGNNYILPYSAQHFSPTTIYLSEMPTPECRVQTPFTQTF